MKNAKATLSILASVIFAAIACVGNVGIADTSRFAELANLPFVENVATNETAETLMEELLFQRAVQSYLWALPAMNVVAMKEGTEKTFGASYNKPSDLEKIK